MLAPMETRQTVEIYGQHYNILGKATPSHVRQTAEFVDQKMREVATGNPLLDSAKLAVLSAVNIANDYLKLKVEYDELVSLIEEG